MKYLIIFIFIFLTSCKPALESKSGGFTFNKPGGAPILPTLGTSFTLTTPSSSPNFISAISFSVSGVVSGETIKIYTDATCSTQILSKIASASSVSFTTASLSIGTHHFYTRSTNSVGTTACSTIHLTYNYLGIAPTIASSIALFSPATTPDYDKTPTLLLSGVVSGETVSVYSDSLCTVFLGSAIAAATTVQVTTIPIALGIFNFYTATSNAAGSSACSTISVNYEYLGVLPTTAATMTLKTPTTSPNYAASPVYTLSNGVSPGDTVKVYSDVGCTTLVGSSLATSSTVDVTISALSVIATYNFYSKSTNIIGTSACSAILGSYNYLGPSPLVQVSWTANKETAVNKFGGGYKVYYSTTSGFNINTATFVNVPYVSGASAPVTTTISNLLAGTYYFKIIAFSALNTVGVTTGSTSIPSAEFSLSLP